MFALIASGVLLMATPVILDTDIGDDIDDSWALALLLRSPEFEVKLITVAHDNTPVKAKIAAKYLELVGRTEIPIAVGRKTSDRPPRLSPWVKDFVPIRAKILKEGAAEAICRTLRENPGAILFAIGPVENVADALRLDSGAFRKARIIAMSGSIAFGYGGQPGPDPEWNVRASVVDAQVLYGSNVPLTIAPLDTCGTIVLTGEDYQLAYRSKNPYAKYLIEQYLVWAAQPPKYADPHVRSSVLFDTEAITLGLTEKYFDVRTIPVEVNDQGYTLRRGHRQVRAALFWRDKPGYLHFIAARIAGKEGEK